jgi:hypothetical protein
MPETLKKLGEAATFVRQLLRQPHFIIFVSIYRKVIQ